MASAPVPITHPPPLTPLADALATLLKACRPVAPEDAALAEAVGVILAEPLRAPGPIPQRALALRRGWAVNAAEVVGASPYAPMPLGSTPAFVEAGDALPPGADGVLPPDAVAVETGFAQALAELPPGAFVRRPGEDVGAGTVLSEAGTLLDARGAALARLSGLQTCRVRRPRLHLRHDGSPIAEALADVVAAAVRSCGATIESHAAGSPGRTDVVMILGPAGGTGADLFDRSIAEGLASRPGELIACGLRNDVPAFAVPAQAADALAAALLLLRPVLARLAGAAEPSPRRLPLTRKISSTVGLNEVALLREVPAGFEPLGVADLTLLALAKAGFWLAVPPESEGFAAGDVVAGFAL